jgi:hypothetical protein
MSRPAAKVVWTLSFMICAALRASAHAAAPTCDAHALDADSDALTTKGVAEVVLENERAGGTASPSGDMPPRSTI